MEIIASQKINLLLPLACEWVEEQEHIILSSGTALSISQLHDAKLVGVAEPGCIRLLRVDKIPLPSNLALAAAAHATDLISSLTAGLTVRYGIFIRNDCWEWRSLLVHEFVHTMQYERLGGYEGFLKPYLKECLLPPGYPYGALEMEAKRIQNEICGLGI